MIPVADGVVCWEGHLVVVFGRGGHVVGLLVVGNGRRRRHVVVFGRGGWHVVDVVGLE